MIVSTAGNIGAEQVSNLARLLENACRNCDHEAVNTFVEELNVAAIVASEAIRSWLIKPRSTQAARAIA